MKINPLVRVLLVVAALTHTPTVTAKDPVVVPDFTKGASIPKDAKHDWNLGPPAFAAGSFATDW